MLRYIYVVLPILLLSCFANAFEDNKNLPKLNTPVTIAVKGYSLGELAALLQHQTGVLLRVDKDIADSKVTVFVDNKPLIEVMNGLKTLFQYKWYSQAYNNKRSYQFSNPSKAKKQTAYGESVSELWRKLDKELVKLSEGVNYRGVDAESRSMYQSAVMASFIKKFPSSLQEAFLNEYTICFNTDSPEPEWILPAEETNAMAMLATANVQRMGKDGIVENDVGTDDSSKSTVGLFINPRIQFENLCLNISVSAASRISVRTTDSMGGNNETSLSTSTRLFPKGIKIDIKAPENHLPQINPAYLTDKIAFTTDEILAESEQKQESNGIPVNRSDILALIHKKANIQIIADHYSRWSIWNTQKDFTIKEVIETLGKESPIAFSGCDENYLYIKDVFPIQSDIKETPNKFLRPLQAKSKEIASFGLDQIADMVSLGKEKFTALRINAKYLKLAYEPDQTMRILNRRAEIALEIYGMLTSRQRRGVFGDGINALTLTPDQRFKLAALADSLYKSNSENINDPIVIKVGIYKNNIRIDKVLSLSETNIAFLKMVKGYESTGGFGMPELDVIPLPLPDAPDRIAKIDGYTLIIQNFDGVVSKIPIPLLIIQ